MSEAPLRLDGTTVSLVVDAATASVLHWGARLPDGIDLSMLAAIALPSVPHASLDEVMAPTQLLPGLGGGWLGVPAIAGSRGGRDWTFAPGSWSAVVRPDGMTLAGIDAVAGLQVEIALDLADDVLAASASVRNAGTEPFALDGLASLRLPVPDSCTELLATDGVWSGEWQERRQTLAVGDWIRESRRGRTSHDAFPAVILGEPSFGEDGGTVWGFHLGWSGNHRIGVHRLDDGRRAVQLGELLLPGEVMLGPGETYRSPTAYALRATGLNGLMQASHAFVRRQVLAWPGGAMRPRPVTLNTWEANYFRHDLAQLKRQADAAAALGVERFVLDDGWFGRRDDDTSSLGDWTVDPRKFPDGLGPLAEHVRGTGMEFGLWVEPEMVNPDSELFRAHPEWVLQVAGRPLRTGRHQLVLDLTRPEVSGYLFDALDALLRPDGIAYLKWDHNRDLEAGGDAAGRPVGRRQALAHYALLDRLRAAHPEVEIETCASGGGRADWGVLRRTHRVWTSDGTDALERQAIQRGFSRWFPPEVMGAHISAVPNHQTGRRHGLAFRAIGALFGHLGLELDPLRLDEAERAEVAAWVALHKRLRPLLHGGVAWRLPVAGGRSGHGVVSMDRGWAVFAAVQEQRLPTRHPSPLRLPGLEPGAAYRVRLPEPQRPAWRLPTPAQQALAGEGVVLAGAVLADIGLMLPELLPETAVLLELERIGGG
ncbi:MAG: alpha-galactosidase [Geminicoccaceae bacterium]